MQAVAARLSLEAGTRGVKDAADALEAKAEELAAEAEEARAVARWAGRAEAFQANAAQKAKTAAADAEKQALRTTLPKGRELVLRDCGDSSIPFRRRMTFRRFP